MAFDFLESHTANNTSPNLDFTTCITASYDEYEVHVVNLIPATNNIDIWLRMSTDGGVSFDTGANYNSNDFEWVAAGTGTGGGGAAQTKITLARSVKNSALGGLCFKFMLPSPLDTAKNKMVYGIGMSYDNTGPRLLGWTQAGWYNVTTAMNAFRLTTSDGSNLLSGVVRVYGIT